MHRIAVNYFVLGVEKYTENQHEEALELLTVSYIVNDRIGEEPPNMPTPANKMMKLRGLMKHFHLAVESLNTSLVNQFETGDDPGGVGEKVAKLIVPAIQILQARTHKQPGGRDATILEEVGCRFLILVIHHCCHHQHHYLHSHNHDQVRSRWCAMIDSPMAERKRDYWGTIFNVVMGDDNSGEWSMGCKSQ